jgi:hypothetical protein
MKAFHMRVGLACLMAASAVWPVRAQVRETMVVVVASSLQMTDISSGTLRRVFTGYATEVAGRRLIPVNHPPNTHDRMRFDLSVLGLSQQEVGRFWVDRRIRDEGQPPKTVPSAELAVRLAASLPGVITYSTATVTTQKVRVLTVDGRKPDDPGYALR